MKGQNIAFLKEEKRRYSPQRAIELLNYWAIELLNTIFGQYNSLNWWCTFIFPLNIFLLILILNLQTWLIVSRTRISGFKGWVCFTSSQTRQTQINKIYLKRLSKEVRTLQILLFSLFWLFFSLQSFALTSMSESYHWHNKKQDQIIFKLLNCKWRLFSNTFNTAFLVLFRLDKQIVYYQKGFQEI